jgi:hypothetical protein
VPVLPLRTAELAATKSASHLNRDIFFPQILYAPLFVGVSFGVTAFGNGMQKGGN